VARFAGLPVRALGTTYGRLLVHTSADAARQRLKECQNPKLVAILSHRCAPRVGLDPD
jgi:hypothetical protein